MSVSKKPPAKVSLKAPPTISKDKRAKAVFRQVQEYLRRFGEIEKVDSEVVGLYALAVSDAERLREYIRGDINPDTGERKSREFYTDKNGCPRKHPANMLLNTAEKKVIECAKALGIDRSFREKGRGEELAKGKGRRPVDKAARLRKAG